MLKLGEMKNVMGAHREVKRLGRGSSSGRGGTAGKGNKGQLARTGGKVRRGFEGGQLPLYRRLPKRGFFNVFARKFAVMNVGDLQKTETSEISLEALKKSGVLKTSCEAFKLLGTGEVKHPFKVRVHAISASAKEKIEKAGGSVEIVPMVKKQSVQTVAR